MYTIRKFLRDFYKHEGMRLLNFVPVILGTGICCFFNLDNPPPLAFSVSICLFLFAFARHFKFLYVFLIFSFGFMLAQIRTDYVNTPMLEKKIAKPLGFFATIDSCNRTEYGFSFIVKDSNLKFKTDKIMLTWRGEKAKNFSEDFMPGDRASFFAQLSPLSEQQFPEAYNFKRQQYFNRISARGFLLSPPKKVDYLYRETTISLLIDKLRHSINKIVDANLEYDNAAIAKALITGTKSSIGKDLRENFVRSGTAHVLAISGLHMGIIGFFIFFVIRMLLCLSTYLSMFYDIKKIAAKISLIGAFGFFLISGCSVSAMRALIMHALVILGVIFDREALSMRSIAVAATIIMLISPEAIMFPSFQLSFSAVIAIVSFYEKFWDFPPRFKMLFNIIATTVVATLATSVFSVFVFNQLTLNSIPANIFVIPLMSFFIMPMVIVSLLGMLVSITFPLKILSFGIFILIKSVEFFSTFSGSLFVMHSPKPLVMTILIFSMLILTLIHHKIRWLGLFGVIVGVLMYHFQEIPRIIISPNAKAYGARVDRDLTCFNHCGYFRSTLSAWTKSVGCTHRENFKSKACRKFIEKLDDDSVKISAEGQEFILTKDPEFLDKFSNDFKNKRVIFLDENEKEYQQF
jgi:competence protein ComEC